jgi:hypothetical protein
MPIETVLFRFLLFVFYSACKKEGDACVDNEDLGYYLYTPRGVACAGSNFEKLLT